MVQDVACAKWLLHAASWTTNYHFVSRYVFQADMTCCVQVKGQRIDVNSKIRTRARAKQQAEQWQMVPLPAKLIAMLSDSVSESQQSHKAAGKLSLYCAGLLSLP